MEEPVLILIIEWRIAYTQKEKNEIMIADENILRSKIYMIRGQQVMLDSDLAETYGYETRYFNRQVQNNRERFHGDNFMFQLTKEEFENLK